MLQPVVNYTQREFTQADPPTDTDDQGPHLIFPAGTSFQSLGWLPQPDGLMKQVFGNTRSYVFTDDAGEFAGLGDEDAAHIVSTEEYSGRVVLQFGDSFYTPNAAGDDFIYYRNAVELQYETFISAYRIYWDPAVHGPEPTVQLPLAGDCLVHWEQSGGVWLFSDSVGGRGVFPDSVVVDSPNLWYPPDQYIYWDSILGDYDYVVSKHHELAGTGPYAGSMSPGPVAVEAYYWQVIRRDDTDPGGGPSGGGPTGGGPTGGGPTGGGPAGPTSGPDPILISGVPIPGARYLTPL